MLPFSICRGSSNRDRHLAEMCAALHMGERLFHLVERKNPVDHRLQPMTAMGGAGTAERTAGKLAA